MELIPKSEEWILKVMKRFNTTRESALTAPDCIFEILPDKPIVLSEDEINYGQKLAKRIDSELK